MSGEVSGELDFGIDLAREEEAIGEDVSVLLALLLSLRGCMRGRRVFLRDDSEVEVTKS